MRMKGTLWAESGELTSRIAGIEVAGKGVNSVASRRHGDVRCVVLWSARAAIEIIWMRVAAWQAPKSVWSAGHFRGQGYAIVVGLRSASDIRITIV